MKPAPLEKSGGYVSPAFVHHSLDDAELSPSEFRVFMHICRRCGTMENGRCCEARVETMARICKLRPHTVRKVLKTLVALGWLNAIRRIGETTLYTPVFPSVAEPRGRAVVSGRASRREKGNPTPLRPGDPTRSEPGDPTRLRPGDSTRLEPAEGIPGKEPKKGTLRLSFSGSRSRGSLEEVTEFTRSIGLTTADGEFMFHKWESNGWMNGSKPVRDWQAQIRSWMAAGYMPSQKTAGPGARATVPDDGEVVIGGRVFR